MLGLKAWPQPLGQFLEALSLDLALALNRLALYSCSVDWDQGLTTREGVCQRQAHFKFLTEYAIYVRWTVIDRLAIIDEIRNTELYKLLYM